MITLVASVNRDDGVQALQRASILLLVFIWVGLVSSAQTRPAPSAGDKTAPDKTHEHLLAQLEEIAMCHHAINAAHHDALSAEHPMDQNPYYLFILNSQSHIYPVPERCKDFETTWILNYMKMSSSERNELDESVFDQIGMKVTDIASDAQFLSVVVNKMLIEGSKAALWGNRDKDIPSNP